MSDLWLKKWNDRYRNNEFAFGIEPNKFFKEQVQKLNHGAILLGAEGEGRNAVYAAKLGWNVSAFDISMEGKNKALKLANENKVAIDYRIGQLPNLNFEDECFDALALIYAHFPPSIRSVYHKLLCKKLKNGGIVIIEAFSKNHVEYKNQNPTVGGPSNAGFLFSSTELKADFNGFEILELAEKEVELKEGQFHNGKGSVIRFVGRKVDQSF